MVDTIFSQASRTFSAGIPVDGINLSRTTSSSGHFSTVVRFSCKDPLYSTARPGFIRQGNSPKSNLARPGRAAAFCYALQIHRLPFIPGLQVDYINAIHCHPPHSLFE